MPLFDLNKIENLLYLQVLNKNNIFKCKKENIPKKIITAGTSLLFIFYEENKLCLYS